MNNEVLFSEQDCQIINLLHQIQEVDKMIAFHSETNGISFMKEQYLAQKDRYLEELNLLMKEYIGNYQFAMAA